ncbi:hypothetical protein J2W48_002252 [Flavobacterium piscis]|uniref:Uncharacterized protein n=1 Tax=Flavobacterium piscis TaxID=1114874 RepID=A0ABU1Y7V3_9FLAO|nr:hypothetical protein [Flavobacterium piscis]
MSNIVKNYYSVLEIISSMNCELVLKLEWAEKKKYLI